MGSLLKTIDQLSDLMLQIHSHRYPKYSKILKNMFLLKIRKKYISRKIKKLLRILIKMIIIIAFPPSANCNRSRNCYNKSVLFDCCIFEFIFLPIFCTFSILLRDRAELTRTKHNFDCRYQSQYTLIGTTERFSAVYYSEAISN